MLTKKYQTLDGKEIEAQYPEDEKERSEIDKSSILGSFADEEDDNADGVLGFD